jgi:hypothetical protein
MVKLVLEQGLWLEPAAKRLWFPEGDIGELAPVSQSRIVGTDFSDWQS